MTGTWYEIWADEGLEVPYLLMVLPENSGEGVVVLDPKDGGQVVHRANDYEGARLWLLEDEYRLVEGRMILE
jgi:hypothetical protein